MVPARPEGIDQEWAEVSAEEGAAAVEWVERGLELGWMGIASAPTAAPELLTRWGLPATT